MTHKARTPEITISIVSHAQLDLASHWLSSLLAAPCPDVAKVLYTRNVPEPAPSALDRLSSVTVIDNPSPRGFGANHNQAFEFCTTRYFAVLNPDICWSVDPFSVLYDALEGDPALGVAAPAVISPSGQLESTARALYSPMEVLRQKRSPANVRNAPAWLAGMFLVFRSEAFEAVGGFDERYHLYVEDVDVCSRLRLAGWQLRRCDEVDVVHDARRGSHRSFRHARWHLASMFRYWMSPTYWRYRALLQQEQEHGQR